MTEIVRADAREEYMPLLLIGDEQEDMVRRYLDRSTIYVLREDGEDCALCAVTDEGGGVLEIKNIAVYPQFQRRGFGRKLIDHISAVYAGKFSRITAGTGDSPFTVPFYEKCGFVCVSRVKDWFTQHYDHPIYEGGVQLRDMLIFEKNWRSECY
ncbi:MAG: GNAT family N-acetyltransferase [Ruminococcus sp.]|nr:GNAT family N-acetyltransferase [Ruminococcus sp.]